jgi:hypothetical protein
VKSEDKGNKEAKGLRGQENSENQMKSKRKFTRRVSRKREADGAAVVGRQGFCPPKS